MDIFVNENERRRGRKRIPGWQAVPLRVDAFGRVHPLGHGMSYLPASRGAALSRREEPGKFWDFQVKKCVFSV